MKRTNRFLCCLTILLVTASVYAETSSDSPTTTEEKSVEPKPKEESRGKTTCRGESLDLATLGDKEMVRQSVDVAQKYLEALDRKQWAKAEALQWSEREGGGDSYFCWLDPNWQRDKWKEYGKPVQDRRLESAYKEKSHHRLPDGEYYRFEFLIGMEKKADLKESVVVGVGKNGKCRVLSYFTY